MYFVIVVLFSDICIWEAQRSIGRIVCLDIFRRILKFIIWDNKSMNPCQIKYFYRCPV